MVAWKGYQNLDEDDPWVGGGRRRQAAPERTADILVSTSSGFRTPMLTLFDTGHVSILLPTCVRCL